MAAQTDNVSMALFCDFENVALGVRDASYDKFDIKPVLERLLLKGSIVVKKAYCDWDRYKGFKATMHEANFELIEIPHVRQSGKNSADIRLVVDALDLCYTKSHVNTFVIISGDSDFSPLVSKLRENAKQVIGVGVKQSTSDLLIANCDEFIFYDDLVREVQRSSARRATRETQAPVKRSTDEETRRKEDLEARRSKAIEMAVETFDALVAERGDTGKIWASVLKEAIKRRKPDFNESYYGFRAFGNLLEEAQSRGLLDFGRDEKSGAYVYRSSAAAGRQAAGESHAAQAVELELAASAMPGEPPPVRQEPRRRTRGGRKNGASAGRSPSSEAQLESPAAAEALSPPGPAELSPDPQQTPQPAIQPEPQPAMQPEAQSAMQAAPEPKPEPRRRTRGGRKADASKTRPGEGDQAVTELPMANEAAAEAKVAEVPELAAEDRRRSRGGRKTSASREASKPSSPAAVAVPAEPAVEPPAEPASKAPSRSRRARKPKVVPDQG